MRTLSECSSHSDSTFLETLSSCWYPHLLLDMDLLREVCSHTFVSHFIWTGALFRKKLPRVFCILLADDVHVFRVPTLQPSGLAGVDKGGSSVGLQMAFSRDEPVEVWLFKLESTVRGGLDVMSVCIGKLTPGFSQKQHPVKQMSEHFVMISFLFLIKCTYF